ncbi:MAG TPA: HDOD domain-containing protein [Opitutaceae bacterium]|nr:HDOD domain-containing protein [Opitutaceae bacterium]
MKRVLFVDDEMFLLQALQRMLRPMCLEWEMVFCQTGAAALEAFAVKSFDVVVTDMKMPGMDGATLLRAVARLNPNTVRIGISGQTDPRQIPGCVDITHQFLTKPCAAVDLVATVERTCNKEWASTNEALGSLFGRLKKLPSLPAIYNEVVRMLDDTDCSINAVDLAVARYPEMLSKVVGAVNSAYFGATHEYSDPRERSGCTGNETMMSLLAVSAFLEFSKSNMEGFDADRHRAHASAVATRAKAIAQSEGVDRRAIEEALIAGLLHDAGQLILAANFPAKFSEAIQLARTESIPMHEAEKRIFGVDHAEIASHLLAVWGLPSSIVAAVSLHHAPIAPAEFQLTPLVIVHFADAIENESGSVFGEPVARAAEELLDDSPWFGRLEEWRQLVAPAAA